MQRFCCSADYSVLHLRVVERFQAVVWPGQFVGHDQTHGVSVTLFVNLIVVVRTECDRSHSAVAEVQQGSVLPFLVLNWPSLKHSHSQPLWYPRNG